MASSPGEVAAPPRRSGCATIPPDAGCADLSRGSDRATGPIKEPAQPGEAIQAKWTTRHDLAKLGALIVKAKKRGDLRMWRRGKAVRDYIGGKKVLAIAAELEVVRASVNQLVHELGPRRARPAKLHELGPRSSNLTRTTRARSAAAGAAASWCTSSCRACGRRRARCTNSRRGFDFDRSARARAQLRRRPRPRVPRHAARL